MHQCLTGTVRKKSARLIVLMSSSWNLERPQSRWTFCADYPIAKKAPCFLMGTIVTFGCACQRNLNVSEQPSSKLRATNPTVMHFFRWIPLFLPNAREGTSTLLKPIGLISPKAYLSQSGQSLSRSERPWPLANPIALAPFAQKKARRVEMSMNFGWKNLSGFHGF